MKMTLANHNIKCCFKGIVYIHLVGSTIKLEMYVSIDLK